MLYNVVLTAAVTLLGTTVSAAPIGASLLDLSAQSFSKSLNSRQESNGPVAVDALDPEAKANYEFFKSYFDSEVNKRDADAEADADALRLINLKPASLGVSTDEEGNLIPREAEADPFWDTIKSLFSNWDGSRSGKRDAAPEPFWDTIKNLFSNWDGSRSGKRDAAPEPFWDTIKNLFSNWDGSRSGRRDAMPEPGFWDSFKNVFSNWDGSKSG
ncbi:hypothetical protein CBER1_08718 [Cercospora berteroae]|uniref:Uncharacterized protein n=1 Tax=Cercospora berteroae TaxID=357750 RepID=A0A2S6CAB7_9PEZI|nr:hypothetical protein CBER1_08718 [Cercospora berteroae]